MSDQATLEMIHAVLDRQASPTESAKLDVLKQQSPEVRADLTATEDLFRAIRHSGDVELPAGLKDTIMAEIRNRASAPTSKPVPFPVAPRARRQWLVAGLAAAAAIAIVTFTPLLRPIEDPSNEVAGTMAARPSSKWIEVARATSTGGTAVLRKNGELLTLEVTPTASGKVTIAWDPDAVAPRGTPENRGRLDVFCLDSGCPPLNLHSPGAPGRFVVTLPGGESLELFEPTP